jgi:ketosteroid isomerase-like protein
MTDRAEIDRLMRELYAARARGDLEAVCECFAGFAKFQIASARQVSAAAVTTSGADEFRPLLALLIKTFKVSNLTIISIVIDGAKAAVHWRANIHSKITGATVPTELVDLVEVRNGRIVSYIEFFAQR